MCKTKLCYQQQDSPLSLSDGLCEYRQSFAGLLDERDLDEAGAALFHSHDVCHVLFGLGTALCDEVLADTWAMLGTTVGFSRYMRYLNHPEARRLFTQIGYAKALRASLQAAPRILRVVWYSRCMPKRWPWDHNDIYLGRKLRDIRSEFKIHLV